MILDDYFAAMYRIEDTSIMSLKIEQLRKLHLVLVQDIVTGDSIEELRRKADIVFNLDFKYDILY